MHMYLSLSVASVIFEPVPLNFSSRRIGEFRYVHRLDDDLAWRFRFDSRHEILTKLTSGPGNDFFDIAEPEPLYAIVEVFRFLILSEKSDAFVRVLPNLLGRHNSPLDVQYWERICDIKSTMTMQTPLIYAPYIPPQYHIRSGSFQIPLTHEQKLLNEEARAYQNYVSNIIP